MSRRYIGEHPLHDAAIRTGNPLPRACEPICESRSHVRRIDDRREVGGDIGTVRETADRDASRADPALSHDLAPPENRRVDQPLPNLVRRASLRDTRHGSSGMLRDRDLLP